MRVLITGGSGFVGGALAAKAVSRGWETVSVSRRPASVGRWVKADLTEPLALDYRPDVVVHCAARSSPWGTRTAFEQQNVRATRHLIDFCRTSGSPYLIYISTSAVLYRNEHQYQLNEFAAPPAHFLNDYARTKFEGEEHVRAYDGPSCILRPRAVFGPGDSVIFPRILRAAKKGKFPVIESTETVMADLIYIETLIDYILRVIEQRPSGLFHLSNNHPVPINAFLADVFARLHLPSPQRHLKASWAMTAATGVELLYRAFPSLGEPPITRFGVSVFAYSKTMDVSKCLRELGPPSVALEEGVRSFVTWQTNQA